MLEKALTSNIPWSGVGPSSYSLANLKFTSSTSGSRPPLLFADEEYLLFLNLLIFLKHQTTTNFTQHVQNYNIFLSFRYQGEMDIWNYNELLNNIW